MNEINRAHYSNFWKVLEAPLLTGLAFTVMDRFISTVLSPTNLLAKSIIALSCYGGVSLFQYLQANQDFEAYLKSESIPIDKINVLSRFRFAFHSRGLSFEKIVGTSEFICSDSTFSDVEDVMKEFGHFSDTGVFFYSPERRSICLDLDSANRINPDCGINYPTSDQWIRFLKASSSSNEREGSELLLMNGDSYSEEKFIKGLLFKNSLEKQNVFRRLCKLVEKDTGFPFAINRLQGTNFKINYQDFLTRIRSQNVSWADIYKNKPIELAYLALYAYLNQEIDQDDLFVIQMLSSAFVHFPESVQYDVLNQENAKEHLRENDYLTEDQMNTSFSFLENLETRPILQRTVFSYQIDHQGGDRDVYRLFKSFRSKRTMGFRSNPKNPDQVTVKILPTAMLKNLYAETLDTLRSPPETHREYFGYERSLAALYHGRPISYASPLFYIPPVHSEISNPLGITIHDTLGHCFFDWSNPYTRNVIELGKKLKEEEFPCGNLVLTLLDRPVIPINADSDSDFCDFVMTDVFPFLEGLSEELQERFFVLFKETMPKEILNKMSGFCEESNHKVSQNFRQFMKASFEAVSEN